MSSVDDNLLSVAVVGAGPAGIYSCEALLNWANEVGHAIRIDLVERLPVPYGLLRYGVAPDHPRIKGIARVLRGILDDPRIGFLGGVEVGTDVTTSELLERHHAVILTTGALTDRRLTIPGADASRVHGAAEFVTWYDGHPDASDDWPLDTERVAVVGIGNVALDVARMLVRSAEELAPTDIPEPVRTAFASGTTREVTIVGRRGPWHSKFTVKELRELDTVGGLTIVVDPADLADPTPAELELEESERRVKHNIAQFRSWAEHVDDPDATAASALAEGRRVLRFRFFSSPREIVVDAAGEVVGLDLERTAPDADGRVRPTGATERLPVDSVYTAVGYRSSPVAGVPFDDDGAVIPNDTGRVLHEAAPVPGLYTAGWVKRGPTGVIGTNRSDAAETVGALLSDLEAGLLAELTPERLGTTRALLDDRGVRVVDDVGRAAIDAHEAALGQASGRERTKVASREELLTIAEKAQAAQESRAEVDVPSR